MVFNAFNLSAAASVMFPTARSGITLSRQQKALKVLGWVNSALDKTGLTHLIIGYLHWKPLCRASRLRLA